MRGMFLLENLSGFFPRNLPVVKISPEWVVGLEQGNSSGRIATTPQRTEGIMVDLWRDFWIRETGTG